MSDHGANPILFNNNKKKIGRKRSRTLPTPHPNPLYPPYPTPPPPTSTSENISFLPYSPTPLTVDVIFHISDVHISQKVKGVLMWNLRHIIFYMKTKILADFQICISVPLRAIIFKGYNQVFITWYVFVFANYFL